MEKREVFGTKEWAQESADDCKGCLHNCWYCYARANEARFKRRAPEEWTRLDFTSDFKIRKLEKLDTPITVMYPAHHDLHPETLKVSMTTIARLLKAGHKLLIVSKPKTECIDQICKTFFELRSKILFRFTIGALDDETLMLWEPSAPDFQERIAALKMAYDRGFNTSISCEPLLTADQNEISSLISAVLPHTSDTIWLGLPNYLMSRLALNHAPDNVKGAGRELLRDMNDKWVARLYTRFKHMEQIRWKDSIKKIVGIERPTEAGKDI